MTIKQLFSTFSSLKISTILNTFFCNDGQIINEIRVANELIPPFSPYTLYICDGLRQLPTCDNGMLLNVLFISSDFHESNIQSNSQFNLLFVCPGKTSYELAQTLSAILEDNKNLESACQTLTNALLSNQGLQNLTNVAASVFGNPFWIIDVNFNFLSKPSRDSVNDPNILQEIELGYVLNHSVENLKERKIFEHIQRTGKPYCYSVYRGTEKQIIAAPIHIKAITVGYLQLFNSQHPYGRHDMELLEHTAKLVSLELQKTPFFENNKGVMYSYFLDDLLKRKMNNIGNIRERLKILGFTLGKAFQLLVVEINDLDLSGGYISMMAEQIRFKLPNSIYVIEEHWLVFLVNLYRTTEIEADIMDDIRRHLALNNLNAGISEPFTDILNSPDHYRLACKAAELGRKFSQVPDLYRYRDYMLYHVVEHIANDIPPSVLGAGSLHALELYDQEHDTNLLGTLNCYLECLQSIPRTAEQLGIHVNTLRYRVEKIKEIISCPLENGSHSLGLLLAYYQRKHFNN